MKKKKSAKPATLLYSESFNDAQMLYFSGISVPDPFLAIGVGRKKIGVFNCLEYGRAKKESSLDEILSLETLMADAANTFSKVKNIGLEHVVKLLAKMYEVEEFVVPENFPLGFAQHLKDARIKFTVGSTPFFPKQMIKTEQEAKLIKKSNAIAAKGIAAAEKALKDSEIVNGKLHLGGKVLTSERLRGIIEMACLEAGGVCQAIAAGGDQACDPHCVGYGALRANEFIIVDVFPRAKDSHYYGDMTRTFLKGKPTSAQRKLISHVRKAQQLSIEAIKHGAKAKQVHNISADYFKANGYTTGVKRNKPYGYIHSLGHGLGLDLHEPVRLSSASKQSLKTGMVCTVEPGLYYPGVGGVRIEDVVYVEKEGVRLLSKYHYRWHIK